MALTQKSITELLATNDKAVARALIVLNERQTLDEQRNEATNHHNGIGFAPFHAKMGTSCAKFYTRYGYLSPLQIAWWRKQNAKGTPRIAIYWKQLIDAANKKAAAKKVTI